MKKLLDKYGLFLFILGSSILHLFFLDADPSTLKKWGDISDAGWWSNLPYNKISYGEWISNSYDGGLSMAPLSTFIIYTWFLAVGHSYMSIKLISIVFYFLCLFVFYKLLGKENKQTKNTALVFFCSSFYLFEFSRIGHIDIISSFFFLLSFWSLQWKQKNNAFFTGLFSSLMILSKLSFIYFLPVIMFYYLIKNRHSLSLKSFLIPSLGLVLPVLMWLGVESSIIISDEPHMKSWVINNYLPNILKNLHPLSWAHNFGSLNTIEFFKYPDNWFLTILVMVYFFRKRFHRVNLKKGFNCDSETEVFSIVCVLLFFPLILISDFSDRRFFPLIFPLIFLASKNTSLIISEKEQPSSLLSYILCFFFLCSLIQFFPDNVYLILKSAFFVVPSIYLLDWFVFKKRLTYPVLIVSSIVFIASISVANIKFLVEVFKDSFFYLIFPFLLLLFKGKPKVFWPAIFIVISFVLHAFYLSNRSYSINKNMSDLNKKLSKGEWIIGQDWVMQIAFSTGTRAVYHSLDNLKLGAPNLKVAEQLKPKYLFWREEKNRTLQDIFDQNPYIKQALFCDLKYLGTYSWLSKKNGFKTHLYEIQY